MFRWSRCELFVSLAFEYCAQISHDQTLQGGCWAGDFTHQKLSIWFTSRF